MALSLLSLSLVSVYRRLWWQPAEGHSPATMQVFKQLLYSTPGHVEKRMLLEMLCFHCEEPKNREWVARDTDLLSYLLVLLRKREEQVDPKQHINCQNLALSLLLLLVTGNPMSSKVKLFLLNHSHIIQETMKPVDPNGNLDMEYVTKTVLKSQELVELLTRDRAYLYKVALLPDDQSGLISSIILIQNVVNIGYQLNQSGRKSILPHMERCLTILERCSRHISLLRQLLVHLADLRYQIHVVDDLPTSKVVRNKLTIIVRRLAEVPELQPEVKEQYRKFLDKQGARYRDRGFRHFRARQ